MKITITDKQGKEFVFETYFPVESIGEHNKTFLCEEWILISGKKTNEWFGYKNDYKLPLYTKQDVLKAGEMGEINHHDAKHIVSYLDEAKRSNETYLTNEQIESASWDYAIKQIDQPRGWIRTAFVAGVEWALNQNEQPTK